MQMQERPKANHILGLAKTPLNYMLLGVCVFPIVVFMWELLVLHNKPLLFTSLNSMGSLFAIIGMILYLNSKRIAGSISLGGAIVLITLLRLHFRLEVLRNLYLWILAGLLLLFVGLMAFAPKRR